MDWSRVVREELDCESGLNTKDADTLPAEAGSKPDTELKVEDKATGHTVSVIAEDVPEDVDA